MKELDDKAPLSPPFHGGDWGWWWATIKTNKGSGACKTHTHTCIGRCLAALAMPDWRWPHLSTSRRPQQSERGSLHRPGCNRLTLAPDFVRFALIVRLDRADAADLW